MSSSPPEAEPLLAPRNDAASRGSAVAAAAGARPPATGGGGAPTPAPPPPAPLPAAATPRRQQPAAAATTAAAMQQQPAAAATTAAAMQQQPAAAAAADQSSAAAQPPLCRICLQEDEPEALCAPCNCSGSMQWAHKECIQRWVDEKNDKKCEICLTQFVGEYRDPPARPRPHPLVAQLQVGNDDTRYVLLADPQTGQIVARVVMASGEELPDSRHGLERWRRAHAADIAGAAAAGEEEEEEEDDDDEGAARGCSSGVSLAVILLLLVFMLGCFFWISAVEQEGGGDVAAGAGAWLVRTVLLVAWLSLRAMRPVRMARRSEARRYVPFIDLDLERGGEETNTVHLPPRPAASSRPLRSGRPL